MWVFLVGNLGGVILVSGAVFGFFRIFVRDRFCLGGIDRDSD